ncbi:MAG: monomeric [FeFe] hydrogenase [Bacillota bacterium]|nr:monomeric [FeFe] hydrogenase [Bacillota bacterium]
MNEIRDINEIKEEVLVKVCSLAFDGTLEEEAENIPYQMIPGIKPRFRCCVYREREIIRQRVRLAMGKLPAEAQYAELDPSQVVHVIPCACEGCPIQRYTVTDNCQSCLAQKCVKACRFGAITKTSKGAVIDKDKCKKCGKCYEACPYNAIVDMERPCRRACPVNAIQIDDNDIAIIDKDKCINCGNCVIGCPFGAVSDLSLITNVIDYLKNPELNVYAVAAPAIEGQFREISIGQIKKGLKKLGFVGVYEAALGADAVAAEEAAELADCKSTRKKLTSSCCPAFVDLIEKNYPELCDNVSSLLSPMAATAKYIREKIDNRAVIVFIGPCIAKKADVLQNHIGLISGVLTFQELSAMLKAKKVNLKEFELDSELATSFGKGFAKSGGVTAAVMKALEERGEVQPIAAQKCSGIAECKTALSLLKAGKLSEDFIEGMACSGGCIAGPGIIGDPGLSRRTFDKKIDNRNNKIIKNIHKYNFDTLNIHKHKR